ncbi:MAG: class I SAM-dependent methyltransferase [Gammaproteobacteria bacterium]|nr:class I SAM-dependent methyltransferase [Gammaproteobacteria bacterium]
MSTKSLGLTPEVYQYLLSVSVAEDPLWEQLRQETLSVAGFNMQISPEQAQFMTLLLRLLNARKVLEVGTFTGYSALTMARSLPDDGTLVACDVNREWTDVGKRFWKLAGVEQKIDLRIAPALETLEGLIAKGQTDTFDFAFIDADKTNYVAYYESCLSLVRPGGIVAVDNTLWGGSVADPKKSDADTNQIRALNAKMHADSSVTACLVPIGDGLHLAVKH